MQPELKYMEMPNRNTLRSNWKKNHSRKMSYSDYVTVTKIMIIKNNEAYFQQEEEKKHMVGRPV